MELWLPDSAMTSEETTREYYEALERGEPLYPFFAESRSTTKFGLTERLFGYEAVAEALREQTRTTEAWDVESTRLTVTERDEHAWFSDEVELSWMDLTNHERVQCDTRWSGTLERSGEEWLFVGMHVSADLHE
jgi:hypothetical protein